ncbi:MAG: hypothetical protein AB1458_14220 [Bacteroidota bacterium]
MLNPGMLNKRFFISWIVSSVVMFALSYVWHGILLNDFKMLTIPQGVFLSFAGVAYLLIGALVTRLFSLEYFTKLSRHLFLRGLLVGAVCGFMIFIVTIVTGVSFTKNSTSAFILVDMTWQLIEQAIGGFAVGVVHASVWDDSMIHPSDMD